MCYTICMPDRVIHKYPLSPPDIPMLALRDPKVRHLAVQGEQLYAWIEHDDPGRDTEPNTHMIIVAHWTGQVIEPGGEYVGSAGDFPLVWHFYAHTTSIEAPQ